MAFSRVTKIGDGVSTQFVVNFTLGYIDPTHITARVGTEVDGLGNPVYRTITFLGPNLFQIAGAPAGIGVPIVFERTVPKNALIVNFSNGDVLDEVNLDISQLQTIMAVQEVLDGRFSSLGTDLDFGNFTGINVRDPVADTDIANKRYVDDATGDIGTIIPGVNAAAAAAAASAATASTQASNAASSAAAAAASAASIDITAINNSINTKLNANGGTATNLTISGATTIAGSLFNADGSLEVGRQGTGDRIALVDFHSSGVPGALDYSARISRNSGANGSIDIINTGTGRINLLPGTNTAVSVGSSGAGNTFIVARRDGANDGGRLYLQKSVNGTAGGDIGLDTTLALVRFFEDGGTFRGAFLDLAECAAGINSRIIHNGNLGAQLAAISETALGTYGLMQEPPTASVNAGVTVAGSNLTWASNGTSGGTPSGTWRRHGRGNSSGVSTTLFQRIA